MLGVWLLFRLIDQCFLCELILFWASPMYLHIFFEYTFAKEGKEWIYVNCPEN